MVTGIEILERPELWTLLKGAEFIKFEDGVIVGGGLVTNVPDEDMLEITYLDPFTDSKPKVGNMCKLDLKLETYHFYGSEHEATCAYDEGPWPSQCDPRFKNAGKQG